MRRYIYILLAVIAMWGCFKTDLESADIENTTEVGEGEVLMTFNLQLSNSTITSVSTRADVEYDWEAKENVTKITGWAFVFEDKRDDDGEISDESRLLQKVAFKTTDDDDDIQIVYVTLDEQEDACYVRLMTAMTTHTLDQINGFVSKKMYDADEASYDNDESYITTFSEYKHIDVTLLGYYKSADSPDPNDLTDNLAFPLASPGINMPDGISTESVATTDLTLYMVPVASKVDVTVGDDCDFKLHEVTLLNGAKMALMRSSVLANDGLSILETTPLPTNLGGVTKFAAVSADESFQTTDATPIYFYPNEGDKPGSLGYDDEDLTLSDPTNGYNPTYLVIKGRAAGYDVDGYYKIAIRYNPSTDSTYDDLSTYGTTDYTYDIIRDNHYKVYLNKVDNPGYATEEEAIAGVANNISFDILVGTNDDSRNETIISDSGLYSMELAASSVYVRSYIYEDQTLDLDMSFWLGGNGDVDASYYQYTNEDGGTETQKAYITCSSGLTINSLTADGTKVTIADDSSFTATWDAEYLVNFSLTSETDQENSESITIRYGNIAKEIPVYFEGSNISMYSDEVIKVSGNQVYTDAVPQAAGTLTMYETGSQETSDFSNFFDSDGQIKQYPFAATDSVRMANFYGRQFDGYVYPSDMSEGVVRLYCNQASTPFHLAYELSEDPDTTIEPYYVISYKDFDHLSTAVNGTDCTSKTFTGNNFRMLQNVNLQGGAASGTTSEFTAIGGGSTSTTAPTTYFAGNFDGCSNTVSGLYINKSTTYHQGLFSYVRGYSSDVRASIKNLTVDGQVTGYAYVGGLVGRTYYYTDIENCYNKATVTASLNYVGGIVGYSYGVSAAYTNDISSCYNQGVIVSNASSSYSYVGGIAGYSRSTELTSCENSQTVTSDYTHVGGIVGYAYYYTSIDSCKNAANITGYAQVGGIVGNSTGNSYSTYNSITNCTNYATSSLKSNSTTTYSQVGGILGSSSSTDLSLCNNYGTISNTIYRSGGIVGAVSTTTTITSCNNYGAVSGSQQVGGIVGYGPYSEDNTLTVTSCNNSGEVAGTGSYIGGILGYAHRSSEIIGCNNSGSVGGNYQVGGILGSGSTSTEYYTVSDCTNSGKITVVNNIVGGIAGYVIYADIISCTNEAAAEVTGVNNIGGVVGLNGAATVNKCSNSGSIKVTGTGGGGIVGYNGNINQGTVINCFNKGQVNSDYGNIGGIVGYNNSSLIINCYNTATISGGDSGGDESIGGIQGYQTISNSITANCYNIGDVPYADYWTGLISGTKNGTVSDCYYLYSATAYFIYMGTMMYESDMKDLSFVRTLNNNQSSYADYELSNWVQDTYEINNGYPIFDWQVPTND